MPMTQLTARRNAIIAERGWTTRPIPAWMYAVRRRAIKASPYTITIEDLRPCQHFEWMPIVYVRWRICAEIIERGGSNMDASTVAGYSTKRDSGHAGDAARKFWRRLL